MQAIGKVNRQRHWQIVILLVVCVGVAAFASPGSAKATDASCPDVMFIGVRGSGEKSLAATRGMGRSVYYMGTRLKEAINSQGETMGYLGVAYRADPVEELIPSSFELTALQSKAFGIALALYYRRHVHPFVESIDEGAAKTVQAIRTTRSDCPDTEMVLAGYSQGAMAVHQAQLGLIKEGDRDALDYIGGTLLLADGDRVPNTAAILIGGASRSGGGVRAKLHAGVLRPQDVAEPATTVEICSPHDIVCDFSPQAVFKFGRGTLLRYKNVHTSYVDERRQLLNDAVRRIAFEMGLVD
ncbi:MAG TPA: cutinase family protein [Solirubrobacterales bacterium]|nr:cutinase family protein [Solirubrobacterales bacterium]